MMRTVLSVASALTLLSAPAVAGDKLAGRIGAFECADNCYLTIVSEDGTDLTGLCVAPECEPWNAEVAIPEELIGAEVVVIVGTAEQHDGSGTVMGHAVAYYGIAFAD